ncbi:MAG: hypothetical protein DRJ03_01820 [Chloroflexi bacterium]|nr:MAG: hypothetical protein DRJ03_01820 [Chloroflexota bacterium]
MSLNASFGYSRNEVRRAECTAAEGVGDFVCVAGDPPNGHDVVAKADPADFNKMPAVGVVVSKSTPIECLVQWFGETPSIFTGLASGEIYFVGSDAKIAEEPPTPTTVPLFTQFMGVATAPTRLFLRPNDHMVRRIP